MVQNVHYAIIAKSWPHGTTPNISSNQQKADEQKSVSSSEWHLEAVGLQHLPTS
jgi:hypothetical protein